MIINNLQYIESVNETEVQGAGGYGGYYHRPRYADASSSGNATAYGKNTYTSVYNSAFADSDYGYSSSYGSAYASANS